MDSSFPKDEVSTERGQLHILIGEPIRASRDAARPTVIGKVLQRWAEEQADLVPTLWSDLEHQAACAQYVRMCGGNTRNLPIAKNKGSWLSAVQLKAVAAQLDTVIILGNLTRLSRFGGYRGPK